MKVHVNRAQVSHWEHLGSLQKDFRGAGANARFLFRRFIRCMDREIDVEFASFFREKEPVNSHLDIMAREISQIFL